MLWLVSLAENRNTYFKKSKKLNISIIKIIIGVYSTDMSFVVVSVFDEAGWFGLMRTDFVIALDWWTDKQTD